MECAIGLADALIEFPNDIPQAFDKYEKSRRNRVEMIQYAANVSLDWFENMDRNAKHDFQQFAFGCMTRSKKVTYENLAIRDASFSEKVLAEFNLKQGISDLKTPAAFTPFFLRKMKLENRIVMSPMGQYSANNGLVNNWHLVHYGARATGGVGLILTEMTAVSESGRITLGCAGIWNENQVVEWKKITDFIHQNSKSKIGIQLGHSGRKGALNLPSIGNNIPLEKDNWDLISASPIAFSSKNAIPKEMTLDDMNQIVSEFTQATINADNAGFDMIELQAHHGFLLASFLSPLTNIRNDEFGGCIENRLKFPIRVFKEMRKTFNSEKPMSVRISASDWAENGISKEDVLQIAKAFQDAGADIINVSTGNTVENQKPLIGRMWQTPFSDTIRNTIGVPTITTGFIQDIDQINTILLNGRADIVALGRPLLLDANFVRNSEAYEQYKTTSIPNQYLPGVSHLFPYKGAERKALENMKKALKPESHSPKK
jgi:anthraniloyl-CoA monooxygenase